VLVTRTKCKWISHFSHKWGWTETLSFEFLAGGVVVVVVVLALLTNLG